MRLCLMPRGIQAAPNRRRHGRDVLIRFGERDMGPAALMDVDGDSTTRAVESGR